MLCVRRLYIIYFTGHHEKHITRALIGANYKYLKRIVIKVYLKIFIIIIIRRIIRKVLLEIY